MVTIGFGVSLQARALLADREVLSRLALRAEALGYDSVWVTDRLLIPVESRTAYIASATARRAFPFPPETPWLEPLTALTYLATKTTRIRVGTSVLVIPYRNPIHTAKALATADYLSGGRVILGAGIGWWREEFEALGVPFADRAARTLEYLQVIKAAWTAPRLTFSGRFVNVGESGGLLPHPVQRPHPPIWIGGASDGALRRVVAVGDGWHPIARRPPGTLEPAALAERVRTLRASAAAVGRDPDSITVSVKLPFTGADDLTAYAEAGARHVVFDFTATTVDGMLEELERFAGDVRPRLR